MNKIYNINLGGYPFTIDDNAYQSLQKYLNTIRNHFSSSEGCDDIIYDIEVRMAELFQENLQGQQIVTQENLENAISVMGTPADFGAMDDVTETVSSTSSTKRSSSKRRNGKRLFRDPEDKVVGGVCSGLAAYLGIQDPLWLRIATVLLLFFSGFTFAVIYFALMVIVPEATSSSDKLAMKGEPINVESIARTVEEEIEHIVEKGTETIESTFGSKKKR